MIRITDGQHADYSDLDAGPLSIIRTSYWENQNGNLLDRAWELAGIRSGNNSRNQIMSATQEIDRWNWLAQEFAARQNGRFPVWLEEQATDEAEARRALISAARLQYGSSFGTDPILYSGSLFPSLILTTWPFFESSRAHDIAVSGFTQIKGAGSGTIADASGTMDGRINELSISLSSGNIGKVWCGVRRKNWGASAFVYYFNFGADSTPSGTDASQVVDAAGWLANNAIEVTFSTATLVSRQKNTLSDLFGSINYDHFVGDYLIVLGCTLTAADTIVGIQLRHGLTNANNINDEVWLNSASSGNVPTASSYYWIPVGTVSIPGVPYHGDLSVYVRNFALELYAERKSGSGYLRYDAAIFVPLDRHAEYTFNAGGNDVYMHHTELDERFALDTDGSNNRINATGGKSNLAMPLDAGLYVQIVATDALGKRATSGTATPAISVYDRWQRYANNG